MWRTYINKIIIFLFFHFFTFLYSWFVYYRLCILRPWEELSLELLLPSLHTMNLKKKLSKKSRKLSLKWKNKKLTYLKVPTPASSRITSKNINKTVNLSLTPISTNNRLLFTVFWHHTSNLFKLRAILFLNNLLSPNFSTNTLKTFSNQRNAIQLNWYKVPFSERSQSTRQKTKAERRQYHPRYSKTTSTSIRKESTEQNIFTK